MTGKTIIISSWVLLAVFMSGCSEKVPIASSEAGCVPSLYPDYTEVTVPCNVAPLNFSVDGDYNRIFAEFRRNESRLEAFGKKTLDIPIDKWQSFMLENRGETVDVTVSVRVGDKWMRYNSFPITVDSVAMDSHLVYRLIAPGYEVYSRMGIYQRDVTSFRETALIENSLTPHRCMNCHSFNQNNPDKLSFHIRGENGGTYLNTGAELNLLDLNTDHTISAGVYPYWHPSGDYIAYSVNKTQQGFHTSKELCVEVFDHASDIVLFDVNRKEILATPLLNATPELETFPAFSADGKTLYFCSSEFHPVPNEYKLIRYSLCSVEFDSSTGSFGERIDTILNSAEIGKSVLFPRPSPDGKSIMVTLADYGTFPIWHGEADLALYDLQSSSLNLMDRVNSADTESYHSWSSEGRWFVFSSRRDDGLYTRLYLSSVDENGVATKPFLLPQKDARRFYTESLYSYNIPEFVKGTVEIDERDVEKRVVEGRIKRVGFRNDIR